MVEKDDELEIASKDIKGLEDKTDNIRKYCDNIQNGIYDLKKYKECIEDNNNLLNGFEELDKKLLDLLKKYDGDATKSAVVSTLYDRFSDAYGNLSVYLREFEKLSQLYWFKRTDDLYDNYKTLKDSLANNEAKFLTLVSLLIALMSIIFANITQVGETSKTIIITNISINLAVCVIFFIVNNIINSLSIKNSLSDRNGILSNESNKKTKKEVFFNFIKNIGGLNIFLLVMILILIAALIICAVI